MELEQHNNEVLVLTEIALELILALEFIIAMNRQTAEDQYGDAEKAEKWACVTQSRSAIKSAKQKLSKLNEQI